MRPALTASLSLFLLLQFGSTGQADQLELIRASEVAVRYTYPSGPDAGQLVVEDQNIVVLATLLGGGNFPAVPIVDVSLSLELVGEGSNPADSLAHGIFGSGVLTMEDSSGGPDINVFQALVDGFSMVESSSNDGSFLGLGTFSGATYAGDFASVTDPTSGEINTGLVTWFLDPQLTQPVNINNFLNPPSAQNTTIYGSMNQFLLLPEPGTALMIFVGLSLFRRHTKSRIAA